MSAVVEYQSGLGGSRGPVDLLVLRDVPGGPPPRGGGAAAASPLSAASARLPGGAAPDLAPTARGPARAMTARPLPTVARMRAPAEGSGGAASSDGTRGGGARAPAAASVPVAAAAAGGGGAGARDAAVPAERAPSPTPAAAGESTGEVLDSAEGNSTIDLFAKWRTADTTASSELWGWLLRRQFLHEAMKAPVRVSAEARRACEALNLDKECVRRLRDNYFRILVDAVGLTRMPRWRRVTLAKRPHELLGCLPYSALVHFVASPFSQLMAMVFDQTLTFSASRSAAGGEATRWLRAATTEPATTLEALMDRPAKAAPLSAKERLLLGRARADGRAPPLQAPRLPADGEEHTHEEELALMRTRPHDGLLNCDDFFLVVIKFTALTRSELLRLIFDMFDTNGSGTCPPPLAQPSLTSDARAGTIDADEGRAMFRQIGRSAVESSSGIGTVPLAMAAWDS